MHASRSIHRHPRDVDMDVGVHHHLDELHTYDFEKENSSSSVGAGDDSPCIAFNIHEHEDSSTKIITNDHTHTHNTIGVTALPPLKPRATATIRAHTARRRPLVRQGQLPFPIQPPSIPRISQTHARHERRTHPFSDAFNRFLLEPTSENSTADILVKPAPQRPRSGPSSSLQECQHCGRRFAPGRIAVHSRVCEKVFMSKGVPNDSSKNRIRDTRFQPFVEASSRYRCQHCGHAFREEAAADTHARACLKNPARKSIANLRRKPPASRQLFDEGTPRPGLGAKFPRVSVRSSRRSRTCASCHASGLSGFFCPRCGQPLSSQATSTTSAQDEHDTLPTDVVAAEPKQKVVALSSTPRKKNRKTTADKVTPKVIGPECASASPRSYVECPHCHRQFNSHAAERHIPICEHVVHKPSRIRRGHQLAYMRTESEAVRKFQKPMPHLHSGKQ